MKKVLLIFHSDDDKKVSIEKLPPLGILYIAAFLEEKKIKTDIIDFTIEPNTKIHAEKYDLIGFSINISNREISLKEISIIKEQYPRMHIIVGRSLCLSNPELFINNSIIDAVFACEGEEALYEYIVNDDKECVLGIYLQRNGRSIFTGKRTCIPNLDTLPFPAFRED